MEKIKMVALFLTLLVLLSGCDGYEKITLPYADKGFECELCWVSEGINVRAVMKMGEPRSDGGDRDLSFLFSEPKALCGVKAERVSGIVSISLGDMKIENAELSGLMRIEELFLSDGKIVSQTRTSFEGQDASLIELEREDGELIEIYLSSDGSPMKICGDIMGERQEVKIIRFYLGGV